MNATPMHAKEMATAPIAMLCTSAPIGDRMMAITDSNILIILYVATCSCDESLLTAPLPYGKCLWQTEVLPLET